MSDAGPVYQGEVAPRRRSVAVLLTLLMPGLGHVYAGDFAGGLLRYLTLFFGAVAFLVAWRAFLFQPHLPLVVLCATLLVTLGVFLREVWERSGPASRDYVLRGFNHPVVYGSLLVFCHALPVGLMIDRTASALVAAVDVADGAMFPMLFIGDQVLIDRTAYRSFAPERGDLAVVRRPGSSRLLVRRVTAVPGEVVSFEEGRPVVNLEPLPRRARGALSLAGTSNLGRPSDLHLHGYRERNGRTSYDVTYRPDHPGPSIPPRKLDDGDYYVVADNRDAGPDSRDFGPVRRSAIVGRPLYVWWSRDPEVATVAWSRIGLAPR